MRRPFVALSLALALLSGASALAANERRHKPAEYQEISEEDRAAARARAKSKVAVWREGEEMPQETKFPWMQLFFVALTFAVAFPFAWSTYREHAKDLRAREQGAPAPRKRTKTAADEA